MKDKLVTLFGGGGFIGRYVAQALLAQGARVRIAQRDPRQAWFLRTAGGVGQTQFLAADLAKPASVARAIDGADGVVNLVGILAGQFTAVHVDGARRIAEAAAAARVGALVQLSALGADPESPSAYGRSKAGGEAAVQAAFPDATILRPSVVFGREDAFVNRFAQLIARAPAVPVLRGSARFQPVYVRDVADAVVAALGNPGRFGGRLFELGGPDVTTMSELNRWIAGALGRPARLIEVPDGVGAAIAALGFLPGAPITRDQWAMLGRDSVVAPGADGLAALGIQPTPLASVAPAWLVRYRRHGRFTSSAAA